MTVWNNVSKWFGDLSGLDKWGILESAIGLIDLVVGIATEDYEPDLSNQDIADKIDELSKKIDSIAPDVIASVNNMLNDQVSGIRLQMLASALSKSKAGDDLLESWRTGDDLGRNEIISLSAQGLRDVLANAKAIISATEYYKPSKDAVDVAVGSVMVAIASRLKTSATLESDEIYADKIRNELQDVADFYESAVSTYLDDVIEVVEATHERVNDPGYISDAHKFTVELNVEHWEPNKHGDWRPEFTYRKEIVLSAANAPANPDRFLEKMAEGLALEAIEEFGVGVGGEYLLNRAADLRELADGIEASLPSRVGYDNSGELIGTSGNDLLIGNDGDDTLRGLGDGDVLRGNAGNDELSGGNGNDRLFGGSGNDKLIGGGGDQYVRRRHRKRRDYRQY